MEYTEKPNRRNVSLMDTISSFTKDTSLHGIKFTLNTFISKPRRLLWTLVMIGQISAFVYLVTRQLIFISTRPLLTKTTTQYLNRLPFPAVTVCNEGIDLNVLGLTDFDKDIVDNFIRNNRSFFEHLSKEELARTEFTKVFKRALLLQKDLIFQCAFNTQPCMRSIKSVWSKTNLCFTVNSAIPSSKDMPERFQTNDTMTRFVSHTPGYANGLFLMLDLGVIENRPYSLPGVKVMIHEREEKIPIGTSEFIYLAPNSRNFISVRYRKNKYMPPPFQAFKDRVCKDIEKDFRHRLVKDGKYTLRACLEACELEAQQEICGCSMDFERENDTCNILEMLRCMEINNVYEEDHDCKCPIPCEEVIYDTSLSGSTIPGLLHGLNLTQVFIYFDRLSIDLSEQVEDYTNGDVFASIGGQMGLFLGASLITLVEIMELVFRCGWAWFTEKSKSPPNSSAKSQPNSSTKSPPNSSTKSQPNSSTKSPPNSSAKSPADSSAKSPADSSAKSPADSSAKSPADSSAKSPTDSSTVNPDKSVADSSTNSSNNRLANTSV